MAGAAHAADQALPKDYKAQITEKIREDFVDPYSILDSAISDPTVVWLARRPGVCVRFNPKNSHGAYSGLLTMTVGFKDGKVVDAYRAIGSECQNVHWHPFPPPVPNS